MTYEEVLERLFVARRAGVVLGLERIQACLAALGHPERAFAFRVHVGGTNGKGSTCAFVDSVAREAGRRTGLFTSPHLTRFAERFRIAGEPAEPRALIAAAERVAAAGGEELTFFEQATAMALWLFADAGVDAAILEVGLGGRLDATNAVAAEVAAITGVALDHQEYLGKTLEAIAAEKAGIFKPGQRVVIGRSGEPEAVPMLVAHAQAANVGALTVVDAPMPADWELGLAAPYQRDNAATAMAILDHLQALGLFDADEAVRRRGLARASLPGRFETLAESPRIIIDGAHNPHAARVLAGLLAGLPKPRVLILAVSGDKDVSGIVEPLARQASAVIATRFRSPRAMPSDALESLIGSIAPDVPRARAPGVPEALAMAQEFCGSSGVILATGSLFLAGEVRQVVRGDIPDAILLSNPVNQGGSPARP